MAVKCDIHTVLIQSIEFVTQDSADGGIDSEAISRLVQELFSF